MNVTGLLKVLLVLLAAGVVFAGGLALCDGGYPIPGFLVMVGAFLAYVWYVKSRGGRIGGRPPGQSAALDVVDLLDDITD